MFILRPFALLGTNTPEKQCKGVKADFAHGFRSFDRGSASVFGLSGDRTPNGGSGLQRTAVHS